MKIIKCTELFDGKALGVEFDNGTKATSWNDKVDKVDVMSAYTNRKDVEVELKAYMSKAGKSGTNLVSLTVMDEEAIKAFGTPMGLGPGESEEVKPKPEVFLKDDKIVAQVFVKCAVELAKTTLTPQDLLNNQLLGEYLCMAVVELHGAYKVALDKLQ